MAKKKTSIRKEFAIQQRKLKELDDREWYTLRSILGNTWAMYYILLGGREAGKSYATMRFFVAQFVNEGTPFIWLRLTDQSVKKMLQNNADHLVDADIRRFYKLDLTTRGNDVFHQVPEDYIDKNGRKRTRKKKILMCRMLALSNFYSDKGVALFDNQYKGWYNICLDEMNREEGEKNNFDIVYSFVNQMENLIRSRKDKVRIILIGNTLQEAGDLMTCFNYLPEDFGRYYIRKKRAVVDYMMPSKAYLARRKGSSADLLTPTASTFTNKIDVDKTLVDKRRLHRLTYIIKFTTDKETWFCLYDSIVIKRYNKETSKQVIAMRPYLDEIFNIQVRDNVLARYDARSFHFKDLITQKLFKKQLELLKPKK